MAKISIRDLARVADFLDEINDPRRTKYGNIRHKLVDIIVTAFTAALCGYEYCEETEELGRLKPVFFKRFLELPNGIPDESVFRRVSQCINPYHLKEGPENRLAGIRARTKKGGDNARPVNIDGKTIRGSGFHVVSVRVGEHGLTLGQLTAEGKSNGISAVPKLPEITGDIVTADAMSCRTETALKIWEKWADYILALKEKQKTLYHNTKDYFEGTGSVEIDELPKDLWQGEEEKGHGRKERREVRTVTDIERTGNKAAWQDVKTLIQYRTFRTVGWKGNSTNG